MKRGSDAEATDRASLDLLFENFDERFTRRVLQRCFVQQEDVHEVGAQFPQADLQALHGALRSENAPLRHLGTAVAGTTEQTREGTENLLDQIDYPPIASQTRRRLDSDLRGDRDLVPFAA